MLYNIIFLVLCFVVIASHPYSSATAQAPGVSTVKKWQRVSAAQGQQQNCLESLLHALISPAAASQAVCSNAPRQILFFTAANAALTGRPIANPPNATAIRSNAAARPSFYTTANASSSHRLMLILIVMKIST